MDKGEYDIKNVCKQCRHWNKNKRALVTDSGESINQECSVLLHTDKVWFGTMGEGVDEVETASDFGCSLFESDYYQEDD